MERPLKQLFKVIVFSKRSSKSSMKLKYNNQTIPVTTTKNSQILKYHFQKLYYAIIIKECNRYSTIAHKQRIDVVMTDDRLNILSIKKEMHENTVFEDKKATTTILLPLNYFEDLEKGKTFQLEEIERSTVKIK